MTPLLEQMMFTRDEVITDDYSVFAMGLARDTPMHSSCGTVWGLE